MRVTISQFHKIIQRIDILNIRIEIFNYVNYFYDSIIIEIDYNRNQLEGLDVFSILDFDDFIQWYSHKAFMIKVQSFL